MVTVFRGGRALFNMLPGNAPQQLPIPGLAELPKLVPGVPTPRLPVGRRSTPFEELPEDIARRGRTGRLSLDEALEEYRLQNLDYRPRRIHDAPYETFDPVTGQKVRPTWNLLAPSSGQTEMLLQASELGDLDGALSIVLNSIKRAENPNQLYASLIQLRALRNTFGARDAAGAPSRITRSGASDTAAYGGVSRTEDLSQVGSVGELSPTVNSIIDTEVWRAAYRVGIPESELGKWPDAFKSVGIESLVRGEKTELMRIRDLITKIRTRKANTPEKLRQNIAELDELISPNGPIARNALSPRETEIAIEQYNYARGVLSAKLGTPDSRGLKSLEKHLGKGLPEDKLHALFLSAVNSADSMDELETIAALAKTNIKSLIFVDNIEGEAMERVGSMLAARARAAREAAPDRFASPQPRQIPGAAQTNEEFARNFSLQNERYRNRPLNPYGDNFGAALPYAMSNDAAMQIDWKNFGKGPMLFGPGRNYRSSEVLDPATKKYVHVVERWNKETKAWEETSRAAVNPNRLGPRVPEYEWIGDAETGMAIRAPQVEFQNFFHRISKPSDGSSEILSPIQRVKESLVKQRDAYGLNPKQSKKVIDETVNLIEEMVSRGAIVPNTTEYNWMHTVFGRLALDVSGPGVFVSSQKRLVARDKNYTRRVAALKALEKAEEAGIVPQEASVYIRSIAPAENVYEKARAAVPAVVPPRPVRPQGRVIDSTLEVNEKDALNELIAQVKAESAAYIKSLERQARNA
jgi:hypothetical protein